MTAATAALPPEFSRHWVKRLALAMGVPTETARHWTFRRLPDARRKEIAQALILECARLETLIADTRRRWEEVADAPDSETRRSSSADGAGRAMARLPADSDSSAADRMGRPRLTI